MTAPGQPVAGFEFRFEDSEVSAVAAQPDGRLVLHIAAASVEQHDGRGAGVFGYMTGVQVECAGARWSPGSLGDCVGRIATATLQFDGVRRGALPLPFEQAADVRLELSFSNRSQLVLTARALDVACRGEPRFRESYSC